MLILDGPPLRLACDRCHKRKQRCTRTGINDTKPCERCREAGSQCVYSPPSRLGRPSNKLKRERQQHGNSHSMTPGSRPSSNTTSPTPPPHPAHSFSLSASSVPIPTYMPMANGRSKTKTRRSQSTIAAASLGFKPPSPPSVSSQFSDTASSPSSYNFGSPPLHAMDAAGGNAPFHNFQIPRSQPQQCHQQAVSGSMMVPSPEHHPGSLFIAPEQQSWCPPPQDHSNNINFSSPTYEDAALLLGQRNQRQQQHQPQPQSQPLYPVDTWQNLLATGDALQLQADLEAPIMAGSDGNAYSRWKWSGQPVADPQVAMNLGIPVTMAMDGNQPMYYYW